MSAVRRWRTIEVDGAFRKQEGWFKGRRILRFRHYGCRYASHRESRWTTAGYGLSDGREFDRFKEALNAP